MMPGGATTTNRKLVKSPRERVYRAFLDPSDLVTWLPPGDMTGELHSFDARSGGGYRMSLYYPPDEPSGRGKTTEREDLVDVRFVELDPPSRIIEAVTFVTDNPELRGVMTMTATFIEADGGTVVTLVFENLPPGLRPEDNEAGGQVSLDQLARFLESSPL